MFIRRTRTSDRPTPPVRRPGTRAVPSLWLCLLNSVKVPAAGTVLWKTSDTPTGAIEWHAFPVLTSRAKSAWRSPSPTCSASAGPSPQQTLAATGVDPNTRVRDLSEEQLVAIREYVDNNIKTEGDLRREVQADIRRKVEIGTYQGLRHRRGLPVRGQRTSTNARTRKGPRRAIAGKKKPGKK